MGAITGYVKAEENDFKDIWRRIRKRDFSGNAGLAIKNSIYQFGSNLFLKIASLAFVTILARLLMPELFGLYSLALSTILLFAAISNFGVGGSLIRFVSKALWKDQKEKAKTYTIYFAKVKALMVLGLVIILGASSWFLAEIYYQKPIFLALLAGILYVICVGIVDFLKALQQATNYFKGVLYKEIVFQVLRLIIVPIVVVITLKKTLSDDLNIFIIILALAVVYLFTAIITYFISRKEINFFSEKKEIFDKDRKRYLNKFVFAMFIASFSGVFFEYIDIIMLGHFVLPEFLGFYKAAFALIGGFLALGGGFANVLLPIFTKLKGEALMKGLRKTFGMLLLFCFSLAIVTFLLSPIIISILYGAEYAQASVLLRLLSPLIVFFPLITLFNSFFTSQGNPKLLAKVLFISTILNIVLNYVLITSLLKYGDLYAVMGAGAASVFSHFFVLVALLIAGKKKWKKSS